MRDFGSIYVLIYVQIRDFIFYKHDYLVYNSAVKKPLFADL